MGSFSLSLDEIDTAAADLAADLPLGCVIDLAGPGMTSTLWLGFLAFRAGGLRGTGMCADEDEVAGGDGVPFPIFTLIGGTGVGVSADFAFAGLGILFGCITGVGVGLLSPALPRADLDLGALGGGTIAFGAIGFGGGIFGVGFPILLDAAGLMLWWKG